MEIYNPFGRLDFNFTACFLTGATENLLQVPVFEPWFYTLSGFEGDAPFKLLDDSLTQYNRLKLPVSREVYEQLVQPAYNKAGQALAGGYEAASGALPALCNWAMLTMYGILYNELHRLAVNYGHKAALDQLPEGLLIRFKNLLTILQAEYYGANDTADGLPGSIVLFRTETQDLPLQFKNDLYQQIFTLSSGDTALILCPQDLGANRAAHESLLLMLQGQVLTARQWAELAARFFYSAFLFRQLYELNIIQAGGLYTISYLPQVHLHGRIFDAWDNKVYIQVLESFWQPFGITRFEIGKDARQPLSAFSPPNFPAL